MEVKSTQLGILAEFSSPRDHIYTEKKTAPLLHMVWTAIHDAGPAGMTTRELAEKLSKPQKSMSGRITELISLNWIRHSEAKRKGGMVYLANKREGYEK